MRHFHLALSLNALLSRNGLQQWLHSSEAVYQVTSYVTVNIATAFQRARQLADISPRVPSVHSLAL